MNGWILTRRRAQKPSKGYAFTHLHCILPLLAYSRRSTDGAHRGLAIPRGSARGGRADFKQRFRTFFKISGFLLRQFPSPSISPPQTINIPLLPPPLPLLFHPLLHLLYSSPSTLLPSLCSITSCRTLSMKQDFWRIISIWEIGKRVTI